VSGFTLACQGEYTGRPDGFEAGPEIPVFMDAREFGVVQARAAQSPILKAKSERVHEVQRRAGVGAQADDVAGIRRDLRLEQNDVR
jgi:hypothetical protein